MRREKQFIETNQMDFDILWLSEKFYIVLIVSRFYTFQPTF